MRTSPSRGDQPPDLRPSRSTRRGRRSAGQSLVEYAIILAVIGVVCIVAINFLQTSFKTLYIAHQAPLSESNVALAMTATPDASLVTATPTATRTPLTATWTPIPTLTTTPTPTATTVVPTALATQPPTATATSTSVPGAPTPTTTPTSAPTSAPVVPTATTAPPAPTATATATPESTLPDCSTISPSWWREIVRYYGGCE
ncbi:MAG: hypothetical protein U0841_10545 [Chloroflexia bacterium]